MKNETEKNNRKKPKNVLINIALTKNDWAMWERSRHFKIGVKEGIEVYVLRVRRIFKLIILALSIKLFINQNCTYTLYSMWKIVIIVSLVT